MLLLQLNDISPQTLRPNDFLVLGQVLKNNILKVSGVSPSSARIGRSANPTRILLLAALLWDGA